MKTVNNTCQICGRVIKTVKGYVLAAEDYKYTNDREPKMVIAHHGYQRPYKQGWQSSSCFGARYQPYEVACNALPLAIASVSNFIEQRKKYLEEFTKSPPETLEDHSPYTQKTYTKPDGFSSKENEKRASYSAWTYESEYAHRLYQIKQSIKHAEYERKFMQKRLEDWVAPE